MSITVEDAVESLFISDVDIVLSAMKLKGRVDNHDRQLDMALIVARKANDTFSVMGDTLAMHNELFIDMQAYIAELKAEVKVLKARLNCLEERTACKEESHAESQ
jgi:hypothetical protein